MTKLIAKNQAIYFSFTRLILYWLLWFNGQVYMCMDKATLKLPVSGIDDELAYT